MSRELKALVSIMEQVEKKMKDIEFLMSSSSSQTVSTLTKKRDELKFIFNSIMDDGVISSVDLESILSSAQECLKDCLRPTTTRSSRRTIPSTASSYFRPAEPPLPILNPKGLNLMIYIDGTNSMRVNLTNPKSYLRKELEYFIRYLTGGLRVDTEQNYQISLVWFGDYYKHQQKGTPFYEVTVEKAYNSISSVIREFNKPSPMLTSEGLEESGFGAIFNTIDTLKSPNLTNAIVYVTDKKSRRSGEGVPTLEQLKAKLNQTNVYQPMVFGLYPIFMDEGINSLFENRRRIDIAFRSQYAIQEFADLILMGGQFR